MNILSYFKGTMEINRECTSKAVEAIFKTSRQGAGDGVSGGCREAGALDEALKMMDYASRKCLAEISGSKAETTPTAPTKQRDGSRPP